MIPLDTKSWYEVPAGRLDNLKPAFIDEHGDTWIGAKRIPDQMLHKVWPYMRPISSERFAELMREGK